MTMEDVKDGLPGFTKKPGHPTELANHSRGDQQA
jgi:hypothetical protein